MRALCSPVHLIAAALWIVIARSADSALPTPSVAAPAASTTSQAFDLRPAFDRLDLAPRRQGGRPTCSVFTVVGAIEYAAARQQGQCPRLSVEFLNWAANQACGDTEDGGFFSDLWKGFTQHGLCTEARLPYAVRLESDLTPDAAALADAKTRLALGLSFHWIKEWNVETGLTDAQLTAITNTLAQGWPVCGGFRWPKQARWVDGVLQMCPADAVYDGHSVLLVGFRSDPAQPGGGVFLFRNSASDGRDGAMPYQYAQQYMNDAAWIDGQGDRSDCCRPTR